MSRIGIVGAGPAGLIAAQTAASAGHDVHVFDRMRIGGRKFVLAGRSGLNLTHHEPLDALLSRYGATADRLAPFVHAFAPDDVRQWCHDLGFPTFVGTTGRVFPACMQATPILRAWFALLRGLGVEFHRGRFLDVFTDPSPTIHMMPSEFERGGAMHVFDAVVLAMGGASWPRLGGNGDWAEALLVRYVELNPFAPANCAAVVEWSEFVRQKFHGTPLKNIALTVGDRTVRGELVLTRGGLEGGPVYELGPLLRNGAHITVDLRPDLSAATLRAKLKTMSRSVSLSNRLRRVGVAPVGTALLRETSGATIDDDTLVRTIKALPVTISGLAGMDRAISSAGGVSFDAVDDTLMLRALPGVFAAGEMLDWEAPTGGYLLQACFSTGVAAAKSAMAWAELNARA